MRVLICIPCLLVGGTEIQTLNLVEALIQCGHRVTVACYFEFDLNMVNRYRSKGAEVILLSEEGIRPKGVVAISIFLWRKLKGVIKSYKPDVAHVQYMAPGTLPVIVLKMLGVKKILATTHTPADIYSPLGIKIVKFLVTRFLVGFQCITLNAERSYFGNNCLFNDLDKNLSGSIKYSHFTIYNSLPSNIEICDEPRSLSNEVITIGVVSRLTEIKGMDLVIPAFKLAMNKINNLQLLVVGDGDLMNVMRIQTEENELCEKVVFAGMQPPSMLQHWYDKIDILLMPSRSEGFGLSAIEGMARGCVPIVSETGGLPEVVTDECGIKHQKEDIPSIAEAIVSMVSDAKRFSLMSKSSIKRASDFSFNRYKNQIRELYNLI